MPESRAQRMQIVLTLARQREQVAARQMGEWRTRMNNEQAQLAQLEEYSAYYLAAYGDRSRDLSVQDMMTYSSFLQRLGEAKTEQSRKLEAVTHHYQQSLQVWQQSYHKCGSIARMIERLQREEDALSEKRLQKELDELATQGFFASSGKNDTFGV